MPNKISKKLEVVAGILTAIPFVALILIPLYNAVNPELGGIPFFYWYQILWLFLSAALFLSAGLIWHKYGGD
ncbi:MAG: DUF3311 domain-containing protein [Thermoplasmata archaeon]